MARRKVKLAWIANETARRATFNKRKKGLMKKVSELSTLCGITTCAILYRPDHALPEVWPTFEDAQHVIMRFKSLPQTEQCKKMMNQEGLLRQMIAKVREQLRKIEREARETEMSIFMSNCLAGQDLWGTSFDDLSDLAWLVDAKVKTVENRIEYLSRSMEEWMNVDVNDVKLDVETVAMDMEALQRQQWCNEVMNPQEHIPCSEEEMRVPFASGNPWIDACFPL